MGKALTLNVADGLRSVLQGSIAGIMMLWISPALTTTLLLVLPPMLLFSLLYGRYLKKLTKWTQEALATSLQTAEQKLSVIRYLKATSGEPSSILEYHQALQHKVLPFAWKESIAGGSFMTGVATLANISFLVLLYKASVLVNIGAISIGSLTTFLMYSVYLGASLSGLTLFFTEGMKALGSLERLTMKGENTEQKLSDPPVLDVPDFERKIIHKYYLAMRCPSDFFMKLQSKQPSEWFFLNDENNPCLDSNTISQNVPMTEQLPQITGKITFKDVSFTFPKDNFTSTNNAVPTTLLGQAKNLPVLHHFSMEIPKGRIVALVGASGSGKSTILSLLMGATQPTAGEILIESQNNFNEPFSESTTSTTLLSNISLPWWHHRVAYVPQEPVLFDGLTILDFITNNTSIEEESNELPKNHSKNIHKNILDTAEGVQALQFINALPDAFHTPLQQAKLSGGQKQRLALLKALLQNPTVLVLDEATSALDMQTESLILKYLQNISKSSKLTMIIVSHRLASLDIADHINVLEKGRIVEHGTTLEEMATKEVFCALFKNKS